MKPSLSVKLAAGFAFIIVLMTVINILSIDYITRTRYERLVRDADLERARALAPFIAELYEQTDSWDDIREQFRSSEPGRPQGMRKMRRDGGMAMMMPSVRFLITDRDGTVVTDTSGKFGGNARFEGGISKGVPITAGASTVGYVYVQSMIDPEPTGLDSEFLAAVRTAIILTALAVSAIASVVGIALLRHLTSPLGRLSKAAAKVAGGDLKIRVPEEGSREIVSFARQFNAMLGALEESQAARKRLVADAAHELRTPVTLLRGTLEMMLDGIYPADPERIRLLHDETVRLADLVSELRELANADERSVDLKPSRLDAARLLHDCLGPFDAEARKKNVGLTAGTPGGDFELHADGERLTRVLTNLISNALRHTPEGGTVEVSAERPAADRGSGGTADGTVALFTVRDMGPGIPEGEREKIFERFYRIDASRNSGSGGSGLGLSIAREIVRAHGGRIWVDPSWAGGAMFRFTIPLKTSTEGAGAPGL